MDPLDYDAFTVAAALAVKLDQAQNLFTPRIPFSWEAGKTRVRLQGPLGPAWYLSAEATAVFKLLFFGSKDMVDLEKMDDDERVVFWDHLTG